MTKLGTPKLAPILAEGLFQQTNFQTPKFRAWNSADLIDNAGILHNVSGTKQMAISGFANLTPVIRETFG